MKIRSITYFYHVGYPIQEEKLHKAGLFLYSAKKAFEDAGFSVQTTRIASTPFSGNLGDGMSLILPHFAKKLDAMLASHNIDFASLGPAEFSVPASYDNLADALAGTEKIFLSAHIADRVNGINGVAVRSTAREIVKASLLSADGLTNLRLAALANVGPGVPFFPAAYHNSETPAFAIAVEAADLAIQAFEGANSVTEGKEKLTELVNAATEVMTQVANRLKYQFGIKFGGIDISLAPFPSDAVSLAGAFEKAGVPAVGDHGSLYFASVLTDALDRAEFQRAGFNGLMFPVLEDTRLARAAEERLTVKDLLLYSTVCGTGLDTVPLPGDVSEEQLAALLMDIAALSLRLNKPLTARLMPIPGKQTGDVTAFEFDYFVNSKILALDTKPLTGLLDKDAGVKIASRAELLKN